MCNNLCKTLYLVTNLLSMLWLSWFVERSTHSALIKCIFLQKESQNLTITIAYILNVCVTWNPPEVSENWVLKKTIEPTIPMKKKPFSFLFPTKLEECVLTETEQVCQDLCRQNYPFTNNKQICRWAIES